jgi:hypothetical protein
MTHGQGVAAIVAAVAASAPAHAREPPVWLEIDCADVNAAEVRRIAAIELHAELAASPEGVTRVRMACADGKLELHVDDPVTGKTVERAIALDQVAPAARDRLIALAIAELVGASWGELALHPQPVVEPMGARAPPAVRAAVLETVRHPLRIEAVGQVRALPNGPDLMLGGGVRIGERRGNWAWSIDVIADHGETATPLGDVTVDAISAGASLLWTRHAFALGAGLRGGPGWLAGTPSMRSVAGGTVAGAWGGPFASAGAQLEIRRVLAVELTGEGGWSLMSITGRVAGASDVALDGPWLGVQLGVGLLR